MMKPISVWKQELAGGTHTARLASLYCCSPEQTAAHAARYAAVLDGLEATFGAHTEAGLYSAPGRTEIGTSSSMDSSPSATPTFCSSSSSQLFAMVAAVGKQVAGTDGLIPRWSPAPACLRTPFGPSEQKIAGMSSLGNSLVCHSLFPLRNAAFSFRVMFSIIF